jgi:hypothetical protein
MATDKVHRFPNAIIPQWFVMGVILVGTASLLVTVLLRGQDKKRSAEAKLANLTRQVEAARDSLYFGHAYALSIEAEESKDTDLSPQGGFAFTLHLLRLLLYCLLAAAGGFMAVSSLLGIKAQIRARVDRTRLQYKNQLATLRSLPSSAHLLTHRPRLFDRFPNAGVNHLSASQAPNELSRLGLLLFCGILLCFGFVFAANQHFVAVQHGYETHSLQIELTKLRDQITSKKSSLPISGPHFIVELPETVAASKTNPVSYVPSGVMLALAMLFFAVVGSLVAALRFLIGVRLGSSRIAKAPGARYLVVVDFLYSPRTVEETFKPIIADWRFEYFNALSEKRRIKARWISIRYYYRIAVAMGLSNAYALIRVIVRR